jgi:UDP-glucose 4-epimerase
MNILVTGAGVIGCHTARMLKELGHGIVLLDVAPNMEAVASIVDVKTVSVVKTDVTDNAAIETLIKEMRIQRVVHTAGLMTGACRENPRLGIQVNVMGTTNLLDCARRGLIQRLVQASSNVVDAPGTSVYALTKMVSERISTMYRNSYQVDVVSLRYGAVFGAWKGPATSLPTRLMRLLVKAAVERESAVIDDPVLAWQGVESFVDARDCARGNVTAVLADNPKTRIYDVAPAKGLAFDEIADAIRQRYPDFKVDFRVSVKTGFAGYPVKDRVEVDSATAETEIGFKPIHAIGDTIEETARFLTAQ